ncbi:hypothetical protein JCM10207_000335 [Rhodosporidiobolus poonsookiae]
MLHLLVLALFTLFATLSAAAPSAPNLVYPLQAQLPPVARLNETWSWTLLPGTFNASSGSTLTLSTRSLPSWAEFDALTHTFTGLPRTADLGSTAVSVTANVTGVARGASDSFALLVVDPAVESKPTVRLPLADQLASAAEVSGGGTLTPDGALKVPPQWSFSFGFQQYTFENDQRQRIFYTAYEEGTTSLPSWITFDNRTVTFNGLAPLVEGEHSIVLYGSERFGYGDVTQTMRIVVTEHSFELLGAAAAEANGSTVLPEVQATPGGPVSYTIPLDDFRIDNSSISAANLSGVVADFALSNLTFLTLDASTLAITGEVPFTYEAATLPIPLTFTDQYNSSLHTNVSLVVSPSLFDSSLFPQTIDVQLGKAFSQSLNPFFATSSSSRRKRAPDASFAATITPTEAQDWLGFDPSALTLSGTAPSTLPSYGSASVSVLATPSSGGATSRAEFVFAVVESSTNTTTTHPHHPGSHSGLSRSAQLGLGLGLGLGGGLLLLALLAFCCWKKRSGDDEGEDERKMRRSASQQLAGYSPNPGTDGRASQATVVAPESYEKGDGEKGELAPPLPGAEGMALPLHQAQQQQQQQPGARRFDVMGMIFRSESGWSAKSKKRTKAAKEDVSYPRPPLPQESSLFGLGIDDDGDATGPHQVVVIEDENGERRTTYREMSDPIPSAVAVAAAGGPRAQTPSSSGNGSRRGGPGRVSSWESGGSSSLFYSDRSAGSPSPSHTSSPASGSSRGRRRVDRPPSIPQRRRDFLPLPLHSPSASPNSSPVPSPTRDTYDVSPSFYTHTGADASLERDQSGGSVGSGLSGEDAIRIVGSHSESTSEQYSSNPSNLDASASNLPHVASFQQYSSPSRSGSYPSDSPSSDSLPAPRLIPFTSERRPPPFSRTFTSQSSLRARGPDAEAVEDAPGDESYEDEEEGEWEEGPSGISAVSSARRRGGIRPASGVYHGEGEPEDSVVYYGPDDSQEHSRGPRETWRSPSGFADSVYSYDDEAGDEGGVRYVGSVASTSAGPSPYLTQHQPPTPRSDVFFDGSRHSTASAATTAPTLTSAAFPRHSGASSAHRPASSSQHKRQSSFRDPIRVALSVNVPFRFTPKLASPPFVALTSSPGRGGPPRATYHAVLERPEGAVSDEDDDEYDPLPDFLHFDGAAMEMFGLARRSDVGTWRVAVVERKALRTPGSPSRSGSPTRNGRLSPEKDWEDVTEMVVGRFELDVGFKDGDDAYDDGEEGELRIVTY